MTTVHAREPHQDPMHRADPRRPWKAITAGLVAALAVLVTQGAGLLPAWLILVLAALMAGLATYYTPNPTAPARRRP